jgi:hypothetical protein
MQGRRYAEEVFADNLSRGRYADLATDAGGRVTLPALVPGLTYRLVVGEERVKDFPAGSGEAVELGEVVVDGE